MEALFKYAFLAWNPILATRRRLHEGNLTLGPVIGPFLTVVVGCNLLAFAAQQFFFESVYYGAGAQFPDHPIMGEFPVSFLSALGSLVPIFVVSLLPLETFAPVGRNATIASMFILAAAWAFYGAAFTVPIYFIAGVAGSADPQSGILIYFWLSIPTVFIVIGLMIWFWFSVLRGVLNLSSGAVGLITISALGSLIVLVGISVFVLVPLLS